jgi:1-acyl-sn-glycerol-3-phosphate acyltransferase
MLLIKRSNAPVVPVAIEGAFDIWRIGQKLPHLRGRLAVQAAPAISAEDLLKDGPDAGLERLKRIIETMRLELRAHLRRTTRGRFPAPGPGDVPYWESSHALEITAEHADSAEKGT